MEHSFGNWVKRRRKALDLTQQELAKKVGCSTSLIFKIEMDERRPSRQMAELLARHLEVPADQRHLFLQIARQQKGIQNLDSIGPGVDSRPQRTASQSFPLFESPQSNLPTPPTSLIGREPEVAMVLLQFQNPACRLLTLTGPGGIGKTRLAIEAAHRLESRFADGVYFISLAGITMAESIIPVIADVLGLGFSGPAEPILQITNILRTKEILLVVDNMEHLVEGGSLLVEILQKTQGVRMLVTSREPLRLQWEWIFEVQGLPVPEETDTNLENNSAILLFAQRARQTSHNFSLGNEDLAAIIRICKLVGGLPLAIELAASWARSLSCREIELELERSLDLLETRNQDVPLRHRSIKTVFDQSWQLLTEAERTLLMRLSIFQGGFTRQAATAITGATIALLSSLVDKSLLRHVRNPDRYDLHELIRQYTFARLQSNPAEERQISEKYAAYYADWICSLEGPFKSAAQSQISHQIRAETSNWHPGWHWAVENRRLDLLRKMTPCLNWYFEVHGYYQEALSAFRAAVDGLRAYGAPASLGGAAEISTFALLVDSLGWFKYRTGDLQEATSLLAESLDLARETGDLEVLYYIYGNWGYLSLSKGDIAEANRLTNESLVCARALNSPWHIAIPISVLGIVAYQQGNLREAHRQLTESLQIWRTVGDPRGLVFCMLYLAMTNFALNDTLATQSISRESNQIAEANMDRWAHAFGLDMLGLVSLSQGQNEEALAYFDQSIALSREIGDALNATQTSIHKGQVYAALRSREQAGHLLREAYAGAHAARWTPLILNALVSYVEMPNGLSSEVKLAVAVSVLSHFALSPHLRARCERLCGEMTAALSPERVRAAEELGREKTAEDWAHEILG